MGAAPGSDKTPKCGAQRPNQPPGTLCKQDAGWGTDHPGVGCCKRHGGCTPNQVKAARKEIARRECLTLGVPIDVDPGEALLRAVHHAAGNVAYYHRRVVEMGDALLVVETGSGGAVKQTESPWVRLYNEERDRLVGYSQAALRAGVEQRRLELAERDATRILEAQMAALQAIGIADALLTDRFRAVFAAHLVDDTVPAALGSGTPG